ncbi:hypothetical protein Tsubulata_029233 [Turnera subulata]|uniref:Uncharacterized protein n=1 Tax=Turnera subulata TaxID=218843 RepID=A0A9Q0JBV1_9ROSI|nr:hypothetical protein Tsubulata_029233 [Turnera subulata]
MRKRKPTRSSASPSITFLIIKIRAWKKYLELPMATVVFFFFRKATVVVVYYSASPKDEHNWAAIVVCSL